MKIPDFAVGRLLWYFSGKADLENRLDVACGCYWNAM